MNWKHKLFVYVFCKSAVIEQQNKEIESVQTLPKKTIFTLYFGKPHVKACMIMYWW